MRPEEYVLIVLRRWWLVVLAALAAAGVGYAYSASQPRTYQTSTQLMAIAQPPDYWMDLYAKNRLGSYQGLIDNWDFVSSAVQAAGLDIDPGAAMDGLALGRNSDANTIQIVKTDTDPARAAAVVNAVADAFVIRSAQDNQELLQNSTSSQRPGTVEIIKLSTPGPPETPIGPRIKLNTAAALLLGLAFGVLLTFAVEYLDDTLRTEEDVDRYLTLPTLSGIPRP